MKTIGTGSLAQAFGIVESLYNPTQQQADAMIDAIKDYADTLLDWWDVFGKGSGAPSGHISGITIVATDFPDKTVTISMKYYFMAERFRDARAFIKYQAEYAPKWHYDPI